MPACPEAFYSSCTIDVYVLNNYNFNGTEWMRMIWPFFFKPVIFLGIKEKYVQSQFNSFSLFYHRFTDSLSAKLCIVIRTVYRRNVLKYDDMIFLVILPSPRQCPCYHGRSGVAIRKFRNWCNVTYFFCISHN